ncbi:MAG: hypothetical protein ABIE94_05190 [archaeon]
MGVKKSSLKEPPTIKFKGLYDWEGLYKLVWQWMLRQRYRVHEDRYREKVSSPLGNDLKVHIIGNKEINEYVKYHIDVYYRIFDLKEIDVVDSNGVKKKMTRGRILIRMFGQFELDYANRFTGTPFLEFLGKAYMKVQDRMIELKYEDDLHYHIYDLHAAVRSFLGMQFAPEATVGTFDGRREQWIDTRLERSAT